MEASGQIRQASQNQAFEAVKARVTTRAFGFRIGAFGVDYTSKKVEVDPDDQAGRRKQGGSKAGGAGYSPAGLRSGAGRASSPDAPSADAQASSSAFENPGAHSSAIASASGRTDGADHPDPAWRRGLAAYVKARDLLLSDSSRSGRVSLAVA